jgi:type II secretory pathway pseudopilin PulG
MTQPAAIRRRHQPSEEGYILLAVIFLLALLIISLAVAAPAVRKEIQRDRELETMHRGLQYARAIKLYYKKYNAFPPSIDALVKTNGIRFLRKKWVDPTTGKEEWKPIRYGQAKTQTMGFFGQPIAGTTLAGTGPSGGNGLMGASTAGSSSLGSNQSSSLFGSSVSSSLSGSSDSGTGQNVPLGTGTGSTDSSGTTSAPGSTDSSSGGTGAGSGTGTGTGTSTGTSTGLTGQTFGGQGIVGFSPNNPKQSILVYKKKNHYNEWEFLYDPIAEQMKMQGGNLGNVGQQGTQVNGSPGLNTNSSMGGTNTGGTNSGNTTGGTSSTPGSTTPQ